MKAAARPSQSQLRAGAAAKAAAERRGLGPQPPVLNQPATPSKKQRVHEILGILRSRWPAFKRPWPLRVGVHSELVAFLDGEVSPAELSLALKVWTRSPVYLQRIAKGRVRLGLDGSPSEEFPTAEHRTAAAQRLAQRAA